MGIQAEEKSIYIYVYACESYVARTIISEEKHALRFKRL